MKIVLKSGKVIKSSLHDIKNSKRSFLNFIKAFNALSQQETPLLKMINKNKNEYNT